MGNGIGGHTSPYQGRTNDWITPKFILDALGEFDLDPSISLTQPWPTAKKGYTIVEDGFNREWAGRVWVNPPYGPETGRWLEKLANHGNGIALVFSRTETQMFFDHVWPKAHSIFFFHGRLYFHYPNGEKAKANAGGPSCLIAYGENNTKTLAQSGLDGILIKLKEQGGL